MGPVSVVGTPKLEQQYSLPVQRYEECNGESISVVELGGAVDSLVVKAKGFPRPDYFKMSLLQVGLNRYVATSVVRAGLNP